MGVVDGLIGLGIFGGFIFWIVLRLMDKNPKVDENIRGLFKPTYIEPKIIKSNEHKEQIWNEARMSI